MSVADMTENRALLQKMRKDEPNAQYYSVRGQKVTMIQNGTMI